MKVVKGNLLNFVPANHEDPKDPGTLKKVLAVKEDLLPGRIQMVNWAILPTGKSFADHYHEDMTEIFVIISGQVRATVNKAESVLEKGDMIIVEAKEIHQFENIGDTVVEYLAMGISQEKGGKTIIV